MCRLSRLRGLAACHEVRHGTTRSRHAESRICGQRGLHLLLGEGASESVAGRVNGHGLRCPGGLGRTGSVKPLVWHTHDLMAGDGEAVGVVEASKPRSCICLKVLRC